MTTTTHAHERTTHKRSTSASLRKSSKLDAIALLKKDHAEVKRLFSEFDGATGNARKQELATSICDALTTHATIEEEIFYPAAREALEDDAMLDEAAVEHQTAKDLIAAIQAGKAGDDKWDAKVKVLSEYIKHHVKEEEKEMFPALRKTSLDSKALGEQLMAREEELSH